MSELDVEDGVTGKLAITSREKDVQAPLSRLLSRRNYSAQKLHLSLRPGQGTESILLTADRSVRSDRELDPDIVDRIQTALLKVR